VPSKHALSRLSAFLLGMAVTVILASGSALAQEIEVTPNTSVTPSRTVQPWIYQMAVGAVIIGVIVVVAVLVAYLRFSPKFFGREEGAAARAPGTRPPILARQAAVRRPPPAQAASSPAAAPGPAPAGRPAAAATAVAERPTGAPPASEEAPSEGSVATEEASAEPEETGPAGEQSPAPAAQPSPAQPAASSGGGTAMDQETFDRVLREQLDKGVDRRVAEGRARAAAVVAARKKA
jgi:hypothetical protein